jgi:hypothetical protein
MSALVSVKDVPNYRAQDWNLQLRKFREIYDFVCKLSDKFQNLQVGPDSENSPQLAAWTFFLYSHTALAEINYRAILPYSYR